MWRVHRARFASSRRRAGVDQLCGSKSRRVPLVGSRVTLSAALLASTLGLLAAAPSASAYATIDQYCVLRAYLPFFVSSYDAYEVSGAVDCGNYTRTTGIQVWSQVQNGSNWYLVSGSENPPNPDVYAATGSYNFDYMYVGGVSGHVYRSADKGGDGYLQGNTFYVYTPPGFVFYNSSGWTCC